MSQDAMYGAILWAVVGVWGGTIVLVLAAVALDRWRNRAKAALEGERKNDHLIGHA
ncbi:MAG: hypothetical protein ACYC3W_02295 [Candidatus Nanopelagicales bacterium]